MRMDFFSLFKILGSNECKMGLAGMRIFVM